jgi:hypothetical protein
MQGVYGNPAGIHAPAPAVLGGLTEQFEGLGRCPFAMPESPPCPSSSPAAGPLPFGASRRWWFSWFPLVVGRQRPAIEPAGPHLVPCAS